MDTLFHTAGEHKNAKKELFSIVQHNLEIHFGWSVGLSVSMGGKEEKISDITETCTHVPFLGPLRNCYAVDFQAQHSYYCNLLFLQIHPSLQNHLCTKSYCPTPNSSNKRWNQWNYIFLVAWDQHALNVRRYIAWDHFNCGYRKQFKSQILF